MIDFNIWKVHFASIVYFTTPTKILYWEQNLAKIGTLGSKNEFMTTDNFSISTNEIQVKKTVIPWGQAIHELGDITKFTDLYGVVGKVFFTFRIFSII